MSAFPCICDFWLSLWSNLGYLHFPTLSASLIQVDYDLSFFSFLSLELINSTAFRFFSFNSASCFLCLIPSALGLIFFSQIFEFCSSLVSFFFVSHGRIYSYIFSPENTVALIRYILVCSNLIIVVLANMY